MHKEDFGEVEGDHRQIGIGDKQKLIFEIRQY